jgi:transposase
VVQHKTPEGELTIGLDVSDRYIQVCVLDADGTVEEETRMTTRPETLRRWFGSRPRARVALEVGTHSPWISRLLQECGHEVLVANPRKLRMIYTNDSKSDRVDAQYLARVARLDPKLLSPIRHRGPQTQADLALLRARDALVRSRTLLINHVRGATKSFGQRLRGCSADSFAKRGTADLPEPLRTMLAPVLQTIAGLTAQIREYDRRVDALVERYPESEALQQPKGVGALTSIAYMLVLEDPHRFRRSREVGAYVGLRPRRGQSGSEDPQLRITKAGDPMLRRLLVHAAHYILGPFGPDTDLRRKGLALAARGGKNAKKRAVVAVARKLAVLLHHLWITGEVYEPLRNASAEEATPILSH